MPTMLPTSALVRSATPVDLAVAVAKTLSHHARRATPAQPEQLDVGFPYLWTLLDRVNRGQKLVRAESRVLQIFAQWRQAVWFVEHTNEANLVLLAGVLRTVGEQHKARPEDPRWAKAQIGIRRFIRDSYGCGTPKHLIEPLILRWANYVAQDLKAIPLWLRDGRQPPVEVIEEAQRTPARVMLSDEGAYDDA